jgi:hypothetical protein
MLVSPGLNGTRGLLCFQEKLLLKKLKFRLNEPTPYVFMLRFLKAAQSEMKVCGFRKGSKSGYFFMISCCILSVMDISNRKMTGVRTSTTLVVFQ